VSDNGSFESDIDQDWADPAERAIVRRRPSIASVVISVLLVGCVITGVAIIGHTNFLPGAWYAMLVIADIVLAAVAVILLFLSGPSTHKVRFWLATALSVVLAAGNLGMAKLGSDAEGAIQGIQAKPETILYDVVVLSDGPDDVKQLTGSTMGEVQNDPLGAVVNGQVLNRVNVTFQPSPTWTGMVDLLTNKDVLSMVIQDGFMQVLTDADPDTYAMLKIIDSFEIETSLAQKPSTSPTPSPSPSASTEPQNAYVLYISGMDTYGSIATRARSDVNILMVVNPTTGRILLVNTPRDFYVQLRGTTGLRDKLTHAGVYGIDVSVGTIEDLYDITINYYLRINFNSLISVIDTLGGVDVNSEYAFSSRGYSFNVGMNHMDGQAALAFSRARYNFAGGDRVRGQNQERVIEAIIKKISQPSMLMNYTQILGAVQSAIQTSMTEDEIAAQVRQQLETGTQWDVTSISVDGAGAMDYTYTYPGQRLYVMVPDESTVNLAKDMIQSTLNGT